jgi:hypothetical protein
VVDLWRARVDGSTLYGKIRGKHTLNKIKLPTIIGNIRTKMGDRGGAWGVKCHSFFGGKDEEYLSF